MRISWSHSYSPLVVRLIKPISEDPCGWFPQPAKNSGLDAREYVVQVYDYESYVECSVLELLYG